jgi:seryl-tRNA synthetase
MLDLKMLRSEPEEVQRKLAKRDPSLASEIPSFLELDKRHREAETRLTDLKAKSNASAKLIGQLKAQKREEAASLQQEQVRALKQDIASQELLVSNLEEERAGWLFKAPNLPDDSVPAGNETNNEVLRTVGDLPEFEFEPKAHWDIAESLGLIDFARGVKLSGSGFVLYKGIGAQLERALIQFMIDLHVEMHGYTEWSTPFFLNRDSVTGSAHIVKFTPEMYHDAEDDLFALPTAEPALVNIHRGEILGVDQLPLNYVAYSPCWRREAGAAGKDTRGLLRVHQFDKVEMVKYTTPEDSYIELEKMLTNATDVISALGLSYRILLLAAGDISFAASKTYDIEIFAPGVGKWLEVSSVSNCEDFQSRRANIRFRREQGAKPEFVHLLNGSGTALPRLVAALLETYQNEDGSVTIPAALRPYLKGLERITN